LLLWWLLQVRAGRGFPLQQLCSRCCLKQQLLLLALGGLTHTAAAQAPAEGCWLHVQHPGCHSARLLLLLEPVQLP
jgi:hypothetical protein